MPTKGTASEIKTESAPAEKRGDSLGEKESGRAPFPLVGIGASAGGLEAFRRLLDNLPLDTGMAFVLVQHLDPKHESILADLLAKRTKMAVSEVRDGMRVEPNHVYVIPPNANMTVSQEGGILSITSRGETSGQHRPIDRFLISLAEAQGSGAIGVILSGTASDGTRGLKAIKAGGGITFAQDQTAKYDGMPRSAIAAGCVDFVLPPEGIAQELAKISRHPYATASEVAPDDVSPLGQEDDLHKIFRLFWESTGVDFALYKQSTIKRRVARRMVLHKIESSGEYGRYLQENPDEVEALYQDLLITVTGFFRDPEVFQALQERLFPAMMENRATGIPIRVWVPGCSTGEEAYSIAICLLEFLGNRKGRVPIHVFGTDLSPRAIEKARSGIYAKHITGEVSPERVDRFFVQVDGGYQISKPVRELCVFAKHDLTHDPPFSRVDLVSCRNLLIYLGPVLQRRVIPIFHYALKPGGFLLLGKSEGLGRLNALFSPVDKKYKIFAKRPGPVRLPLLGPQPRDPVALKARTGNNSRTTDTTRGDARDIEKEADRILLRKYAPPGVIVNDEMEILQFRGRTGPYLEPAPGDASLNLLKMARGGLAFELRAAITEAQKENAPVRKEGLRLQQDGENRQIAVEVIPVKSSDTGGMLYLVLFEETVPRAADEPRDKTQARRPRRPNNGKGRETVPLEEELTSLKRHLRYVTEEYEATTEELQSANEEVLSSNEELQSINEELETSKEELQATNEELNTINEELQNRNVELAQLNDDLNNVLTSVSVPILIVGHNLRIRRFTPASEKVLNVVSTDVGRGLSEVKLNIALPRLEERILEVIETLTPWEQEVQDLDGHWYTLRVQPYRTSDNRIDGAVLMLWDIDLIKRGEALVRESRDYAQAVVETVREPLLILDGDLRVEVANRSFYEIFQVSPEQTKGRFIYELGDRQWDIPQLRTLLLATLPKDRAVQDFEVEHDFPLIGRRVMLLNARRIRREEGKVERILIAIEDITERKRADQQLLASEARYRSYIEVTGQLGWTTNAAGEVVEDLPSWRQFTGQSEEEVKGAGWAKALHPEDVEHTVGVWDRALKTKGPYEVEYRIRRHDGVYRLFLARGVPVFNEDGSVRQWVGTCIDITERKNAEEALREAHDELERKVEERTSELRRLSYQLLHAQEEERKRIALDIHDGIGQSLSVIKMRIENAFQEMSKEKAARLGETIVPSIQAAMDEARKIQGDLRPSTLDDLGIVATLSWFCREFQATYAGVQVERQITIHEDEVPAPLKTVLFRVVQEAMNNIAKHSQAGHVRLCLRKEDGRIELTIQDNGTGFDLEDGPSVEGRTGLIGMRERTELSGGRLKIESSKGAGTTIQATWPCETLL